MDNPFPRIYSDHRNRPDGERTARVTRDIHRAIQPYYLLEGNPSGADSGEYWSIIGETGGEQIMRSCDQTGCSL